MARKPKSHTEYQTTVERDSAIGPIDVDITVEYEFEPGEKEIRYGDNAYPGTVPHVEIGDAFVTDTGAGIILTAREEQNIRDAIIEKRTAPADEGY
jgi:hypothetical protein